MNLSKRNIARFYIVAYILISLLTLTLIWQYSRLRKAASYPLLNTKKTFSEKA